MKLVKPNYSARSPIVNDAHFSDGPVAPMPAQPTLNSPDATFNPGANSSPLPSGPPRFIQPKGKAPRAKGLTNKRITGNI